MDAASEAAALAGVAQNPHFPTWQRLQAANKALDYYIDNRSVALQGLLDDWRRRAESDNPSEYLDMQDVVAQLAAILDGE
jgi:hypothetical protein